MRLPASLRARPPADTTTRAALDRSDESGQSSAPDDDSDDDDDQEGTIRPSHLQSPAIGTKSKPTASMLPIVEDYSDLLGEDEEEKGSFEGRVRSLKVGDAVHVHACASADKMLLTASQPVQEATLASQGHLRLLHPRLSAFGRASALVQATFQHRETAVGHLHPTVQGFSRSPDPATTSRPPPHSTLPAASVNVDQLAAPSCFHARRKQGAQ